MQFGSLPLRSHEAMGQCVVCCCPATQQARWVECAVLIGLPLSLASIWLHPGNQRPRGGLGRNNLAYTNMPIDLFMFLRLRGQLSFILGWTMWGQDNLLPAQGAVTALHDEEHFISFERTSRLVLPPEMPENSLRDRFKETGGPSKGRSVLRIMRISWELGTVSMCKMPLLNPNFLSMGTQFLDWN